MARNNNSNTSSSRNDVFDNLKFTVAKEMGVNLGQDNGNLTTRDVGKIGGRITQIVFDSYTKSH